MIIVGGLNVFPAEIENVLKQHPLVADAVAVGIPDTERGEIIKAFVVLTAGSTLTEREVISFCRERLASYKLPKLVDFTTSLPRTSTGKVARKLLKEAGQ
jgi:long-chain acyl-CoA synthetase